MFNLVCNELLKALVLTSIVVYNFSKCISYLILYRVSNVHITVSDHSSIKSGVNKKQTNIVCPKGYSLKCAVRIRKKSKSPDNFYFMKKSSKKLFS